MKQCTDAHPGAGSSPCCQRVPIDLALSSLPSVSGRRDRRSGASHIVQAAYVSLILASLLPARSSESGAAHLPLTYAVSSNLGMRSSSARHATYGMSLKNHAVTVVGLVLMCTYTMPPARTYVCHPDRYQRFVNVLVHAHEAFFQLWTVRRN